MTQLEILNSLRNALHNVLSDLFIVAPDDYLNSDNFINARNALRNSVDSIKAFNQIKDCAKPQTVNSKLAKIGTRENAKDLVVGRLRMYMATNTEPPMISMICRECNVTSNGHINSFVCAQGDLFLWLSNFPSYDWMKSHKNRYEDSLNGIKTVYTEMTTLAGVK
jgi:hypothetical protein